MPAALKYIVLPFKKARAGIVPAEMRQASNAASAERIAASMASRFIGVVALSAMADSESGDLTGARLLASHGEIGDLSAMVEFSLEEEVEPVAEAVAPAEEPAPVDEAESDPTPPLANRASSLILTAPPEPASTRRAVRAPTKRQRAPAPSLGPLFEQGPHHA